jgi:hypothetical protein
MPSRRSVAVILGFWLAVTGYVGYRDVWPRYFSSGPPPVVIDLADEAAQSVPARWTVSRNGRPIGRLTTHMKYVEADDTFRFVHEYRHLRFELGSVAVVFPDLTNTVRVTRAGDLRELATDARLEVRVRDVPVGGATATLAGTVTGNQLLAVLDVKSPIRSLSRPLDPIPVPRGQPLNPLQPVNRITGLVPGRRWVVHPFDPLTEIVNQLGVGGQADEPEPLVAEVLARPQDLDRKDGPVSCRVIEYRNSRLTARTWVRASDGKVLRQEAVRQGEHLATDRDE